MQNQDAGVYYDYTSGPNPENYVPMMDNLTAPKALLIPMVFSSTVPTSVPTAMRLPKANIGMMEKQTQHLPILQQDFP